MTTNWHRGQFISVRIKVHHLGVRFRTTSRSYRRWPAIELKRARTDLISTSLPHELACESHPLNGKQNSSWSVCHGGSEHWVNKWTPLSLSTFCSLCLSCCNVSCGRTHCLFHMNSQRPPHKAVTISRLRAALIILSTSFTKYLSNFLRFLIGSHCFNLV